MNPTQEAIVQTILTAHNGTKVGLDEAVFEDIIKKSVRLAGASSLHNVLSDCTRLDPMHQQALGGNGAVGKQKGINQTAFLFTIGTRAHRAGEKTFAYLKTLTTQFNSFRTLLSLPELPAPSEAPTISPQTAPPSFDPTKRTTYESSIGKNPFTSAATPRTPPQYVKDDEKNKNPWAKPDDDEDDEDDPDTCVKCGFYEEDCDCPGGFDNERK